MLGILIRHSYSEVLSMMMTSMTNRLTAYLDNLPAFKEYLRKYGMDDALKQHKMKLRHIHQVVPHVSRMYRFKSAPSQYFRQQRLCAPLDAGPNTLPFFANEEDWYLYVRCWSFAHCPRPTS
jgi:hypothetical protein